MFPLHFVNFTSSRLQGSSKEIIDYGVFQIHAINRVCDFLERDILAKKRRFT